MTAMLAHVVEMPRSGAQARRDRRQQLYGIAAGDRTDRSARSPHFSVAALSGGNRHSLPPGIAAASCQLEVKQQNLREHPPSAHAEPPCLVRWIPSNERNTRVG
jgi:hypothetical protein